ncbi:MAG TPA: hypothetical protein VHA14_19335 [Bryobacteraceae bacterium]|nr:hypothetical protein [Bryobacteraceae bacterium]
MGAAFDPRDLSIYSAIVHAAGTPVRVIAGHPVTHESAIPITATPSSVNRSNEISLQVPAAKSGCSLDAEYRMPHDELARSGLWKSWCTVAADGTCAARINQDAERGIVQIQRVRLCGGEWRRTNVSFEILP